MTELKPCPFCGGNDLSYRNDVVMPDNWHSAQVACGGCETVGPCTVAGISGDDGDWHDSRVEAQDAADKLWNRRHTPEHWQLVPIKPTAEMLCNQDRHLMLGAWTYMLERAPKP